MTMVSGACALSVLMMSELGRSGRGRSHERDLVSALGEVVEGLAAALRQGEAIARARPRQRLEEPVVGVGEEEPNLGVLVGAALANVAAGDLILQVGEAALGLHHPLEEVFERLADLAEEDLGLAARHPVARQHRRRARSGSRPGRGP